MDKLENRHISDLDLRLKNSDGAPISSIKVENIH